MLSSRCTRCQKWLLVFGCQLVFTVGLHAAFAQSAAEAVDPFLGSDGGGNVFVGATTPFGVVKAGPDMGDNTGNAGWLPNSLINGFSQTHVSGTGGGAKYGNILLQPVTGKATFENHSSKGNREKAIPGSYSVHLDRYNIDLSVAATKRSAIYQIEYHDENSTGLLLDAGHCLSSYPQIGESQSVVASSIRVEAQNAFSGFTTVVGGWNQQKKPYTVYFYALLDRPAKGITGDVDGSVHPVALGSGIQGTHTALLLNFGKLSSPRIHFKIGISFVSTEKARRNLQTEIPEFDSKRVEDEALKTWNRLLSAIEVNGISAEQRSIFYTALYHTMLMPSDRTGENPDWQSKEPYYDDYYAIWDTFRTSGPLLSLIAPELQSEMVRALVDIYRHDGFLPDARSGNANGRTQGGSNAEFFITDARLKHLEGIDWESAYAAVKKDAEIAPPDPIKEGRGGLEEWKTLGYLPIEVVDRPASKQMEYAADDYEISVLAQSLGHVEDAKLYLSRARNWEKIWNPELTADGVHGFVWPRHRNGEWKVPFRPLEGCSWGGDTFYEGNAWTYSLFVPFDVARVIALSGGPSAFVDRLDKFFARPGRYDVGNEPGFLAPYLYLWVGRADRTADTLRTILPANFHSGTKGLPGNDDSGAMSSWYVFGTMGIFPNAGQGVYLIGSPLIPHSVLHLAKGRTFTITAPGASLRNRYVVSAEFNGQPLKRAWLTQEEIEMGGELILHLSQTPSSWPTGNPPPSLSDKEKVE